MFELYELTALLKLPSSCKVTLSAHSYIDNRSVLVLLLDNGYLLFHVGGEKPVVRQLEWFRHQPCHQVVGLCLGPRASWLLLVTQGAVLFLLPTDFLLQSSSSKLPKSTITDLSDIKLTMNKGVPSAVSWCQTSSANIAVVGTELGELIFVDLKWQLELGGAKLSFPITSICSQSPLLLVEDEEGQVWKLLLEGLLPSAPFTAEDITTGAVAIAGDKLTENNLSLLSDSVPGAKLQTASKSGNISLLYPTCIQLWDTGGAEGSPKLNQSWPCRGAGLCHVTDQAIALVDSAGQLVVLSTTTVADNLQNLDNVLQSWQLEDSALALYCCGTDPLGPFLVVQEHYLLHCQIRFTPEELFGFLCESPHNFTKAETLGALFHLDTHRMYERCAEQQLINGKFATAVHLYHLSKCSHLKRVANFMSYGYLSELTAYIQILFSSRSVEIPHPDKVHLANIMLHSFAEQVLRKTPSSFATGTYYKKFLHDNIYYDVKVAIKLLAEHRLYKFLYYAAKMRGDLSSMLDHLLTQGPPDQDSYYFRQYMECATSPELLPQLCQAPHLVDKHLGALTQLVPLLGTGDLESLAALYDPSRPAFSLLVRALHSSDRPSLFESCTISSLSESIAYNTANAMSEEELLKFFLFVLLALRAKRGVPVFEAAMLGPGPSSMEVPQLPQESLASPCSAPVALSPTLAAGKSSVCFLASPDLRLFSWGKDIGEVPKLVPFFSATRVRVFSVSAGSQHMLALTDSGVFAWGLSAYGQLGCGAVQSSAEPLLVEALGHEVITSVSAGQYHSLAVSSQHRVYAWGWGVHGQLGLGNAENYNLPQLVPHLQDVTKVCGGQAHSLALTSQGEVYSFGCGLFGQLGTGSTVKKNVPVRVPLPEPIEQIATGYYHTLAVSGAGRLYCWGSSPQALKIQASGLRQASRGQQQASLAPSQAHLVPHLIVDLPPAPILQVSCGCAHSALLTTAGEVYTWGHNIEGQLGHGPRKDHQSARITPTKVLALADHTLSEVSCGSNFTVVRDATRVWAWGGNESGQLGFRSGVVSGFRSLPNRTTAAVLTTKSRRIINLAQLPSKGATEPGEVSVPPAPSNPCHLDASIDNQIVRSVYYHDFYKNMPSLRVLDPEPYGTQALMIFIQTFFKYWDTSVILSRCVSFEAWQAAAFLCAVNGFFTQSLEFQLKALRQDSAQVKSLPVVLDVVNFYARKASLNEVATSKKMLAMIGEFWLEQDLSMDSFEIFIQNHVKVLAYPLCLLLLSEEGVELYNKLSVHFVLSMVGRVLETHSQAPELGELLRGPPAAPAAAPGLWQQLAHTLGSSGRSLVLSADQLQRMADSQQALLFTCGHHYPAPHLRSTLLSPLPPDIASLYLRDGFLPLACPRCVASQLL